MKNKAITIADLRVAEPAGIAAPKTERGRWTLIPYAADGLSGQMLWVSEDNEAPTAAIPFGVSGWHAVYVGLLGGTALLRLSSDNWNVPRSHMVDPEFKIWGHQDPIEEVFFKSADLTGKKLLISQITGPAACACQVAYVKLVPLTAAEVSAIQADRADPTHRRLTATIDGFSFLYARAPGSAAELLEQVEIFRNTDFDTLILQVIGADAVNYRSRRGHIWGQDLDVFPDKLHRRMARTLRDLSDKGVNPTREVIRGAHEIGMKVHVSIRPGNWTLPGPRGEFYNSPFYQAHPEWRCYDRDGTAWARMSFAVPEVRAHLVEILREAVRFGADGANIIYSRGVPLVVFEEPFRRLFRERHGRDPVKLDPADTRVAELRAGIITDFMREVRQMLNEEGKRRPGGARLDLSAFVLVNEATNRRFGLDIDRWVDEGLVDEMSPHRIAGNEFASEPYEAEYFRRVCGGRVRLRPAIYTWVMRGAGAMPRLRKEVWSHYETGADGITFWDAHSGADKSCQWPVICRCGHREELRHRLNDPPPPIHSVRVRKLGEYVVEEPYGQGWGY